MRLHSSDESGVRIERRSARESPELFQSPHATDLILTQWFKSGFRNRDDGDRVTQRVKHLGALAVLAVATGVMLHQLHDVAALEPFLRQVAR